MVRPQGKVLRDSEVTSRDVSFKSIWRELKQDGWTCKPPPRRSLNDRYFYIRPGGDAKGAEGVDYFRGEEAVLEYYANILRSRAPAQIGAPGDAQLAAAAQIVRENYAADIDAAEARAQAAAIPQPVATVVPERPLPGQVEAEPRGPHTKVATSQRPPASPPAPRPAQQRPCASRPTRRSLMSTASPMATSPPRRTRRISSIASLIPTSPHVQDGTPLLSEHESPSMNDEVSIHSVESLSDRENDDGNDDGEASTFTNELLADNDDDLNLVEDGDGAPQFGAMDSGDEAEKDDIETGEYGSDADLEIYSVPEDVFDDHEETEQEIAAEVLFAENFMGSFGGEDQVLAGNLKNEVLREMSESGWEYVIEPDTYAYMMTPYEPVINTSSYPGLRQGYLGPTADVLRKGDSPIALLFYFMPVALWQHIAASSNEYHRVVLPLRIDESYRRYRRKQRLNSELPRKTRRDIQQEMEGMKRVLSHELCQFAGLLIARTIAPNREKIANHWKTTDEGAISRGCFGSVLARDRFMEISRNLHFNPNTDPRARTDRAWKIRKLVEVLQRTFARGYGAPPHLAFDEAVLPSRSSFNKMRVYMKDKPHKWGTKLFMLCSAVTAYCIRFEVYCGKKQHASDTHNPDMKSGPAAVVRNLLAAFGPDAKREGMRLVVIDRFYTSVALVIQLLLMDFYCVGTIMTNRLDIVNA